MENKKSNNRIRNITIIAHYDRVKTTLMDQMFYQSGLFRENQTMDEYIIDNMDSERKIGISHVLQSHNSIQVQQYTKT